MHHACIGRFLAADALQSIGEAIEASAGLVHDYIEAYVPHLQQSNGELSLALLVPAIQISN